MVVVAMVAAIVLVVVVAKVLVWAASIFDMVVVVEVLSVLPGIGIEVLAVVNANAFAGVVTALEFPVSTPLGECSRSAAFDCRPLALLD